MMDITPHIVETRVLFSDIATKIIDPLDAMNAENIEEKGAGYYLYIWHWTEYEDPVEGKYEACIISEVVSDSRGRRAVPIKKIIPVDAQNRIVPTEDTVQVQKDANAISRNRKLENRLAARGIELKGMRNPKDLPRFVPKGEEQAPGVGE